MEFLKVRFRVILAAALSGPALGGCLSPGAEGPVAQPAPFSHAVHCSAGLECAECHFPGGAKEPSLPLASVCAECHQPAADNPEGLKRYFAAVAGGTEAGWKPVPRTADDLIFSHERHRARGIACGSCHGAMETAEVAGPENLPSMQSCLACHREKKAPETCSTCHTRTREGVAPASHRRLWKVLHGPAAREGGAEEGKCSSCHPRSSCDRCHAAEPPRDHNGHWRHRGHGVMASVDRNRCATCHEPDYCIRCHRDTAPRTHTAGWAGPAQRHCLSCHLPLADADCRVCHDTTPRHVQGPAPGGRPGHAPGNDCRACHIGATLPHPDSGDGCEACHRF